jgi:hypothetical protein
MKRCLIALLCLLFAAQASAQLYRWVDEKGRVQYGDKPPPGVKSRAVEGTGKKEEQAPAAASKAAPARKFNPADRISVGKGDPAAEAREKKEREEKRRREAKAREERKPACAAAKTELSYAERNRLAHAKKGSKTNVPFTNEEQREEIHRRRRAATQACY